MNRLRMSAPALALARLTRGSDCLCDGLLLSEDHRQTYGEWVATYYGLDLRRLALGELERLAQARRPPGS
jgi:hypothetical protein